MKVLHVTPSHARRDGGPSEVLRGLIPELTRLGAEVKVITTDKGNEPGDADFTEKHEVAIVRSFRPNSWTFAPKICRQILNELEWADIVHVHSLQTFPTTVALAACRYKNVPAVVEPHGSLDSYHFSQGRAKKLTYMRTVDRYGLRGLDGAVYSSRHELSQARNLLKAQPYTMTLGVDPTIFASEREVGTGPPLILYLGRVTGKKRLDLVLSAMSQPRVRALDARLVVAGPVDRSLKFDPTAMTRTLGLAENVQFVGPVDRQQRRELLRRADVFVLPSEDESFGVAVAEALAAGCPVVTTEYVGIAAEIAQDGGLAVTPLDATRIAAEIADLVENPDNAAAMAQRGREYAMSQFTWEKAGRDAIGIYQDVLGRRQS